jgi:hypothetical protein
MRLLKCELVKVFHIKSQQDLWIYGTDGQFNLWLHADRALLWINKAENQNNIWRKSYQNLIKSAKLFIWYMEVSICDLA